MSVELLRSRLSEDLHRVINETAAVLVDQRQASLDEMRYNQGLIAGMRIAIDKLDDRYKNLHAIG